jgi:hypothetical protein
VNDGKHYELALALWSNRDTLGAYVEMLSPSPTPVRMLDVGLDAAGSFDPKVATLQFLGIFRVNGASKIISGRAITGILRVTTETGEQSTTGVNLWINQLHTYAQIAWFSTIQQVTLGTTSVTVPAATVLQTYMKLR